MGLDDGCNIGLVLGFDYREKQENRVLSSKNHQTKENCRLIGFGPFDQSSSSPETYLTLSLASDGFKESIIKIDMNKTCEDSPEMRQSSPQSTITSFSNANHEMISVKRERDVGSEETEFERVSSRVSDEDDEGGSSRKKLRLTKEQSALLEDNFKEHTTLNPKQKQALAMQLNLRPRQVEVWFQNRRARTKLKQTEVDCEYLKRCCESLKEENRRLQKELHELKTLKFASPVYMHLPAATLTMCPSCERVGTGGMNPTKGPLSVGQRTHQHHLYNSSNNFSHHPSAAC